MRLSMIALATTIALCSTAALARGEITPPGSIPQPGQGSTPEQGDPGLPPSGGGGFVLTPEIVDALDVPVVILDDGVGSDGPASPHIPGGNIAVGDKPEIIILDDGVGSGGPGGFGPDGKSGPGDLVIRLACKIGTEGLVLSNVGEADAPAGIKLRWQVKGAGKGMVRLDRALAAGHAAALPGVTAQPGAPCGVTLVS